MGGFRAVLRLAQLYCVTQGLCPGAVSFVVSILSSDIVGKCAKGNRSGEKALPLTSQTAHIVLCVNSLRVGSDSSHSSGPLMGRLPDQPKCYENEHAFGWGDLPMETLQKRFESRFEIARVFK